MKAKNCPGTHVFVTLSRLRLYSLSGLDALSAVEELHSVFEP